MAKARHTIAVEDVAREFTDESIEALARIAKLPAGADRQRFGEGIREAARIYARNSRGPNVNELHKEIGRLHRVAARGQYEQLAKLLEGLSSKARNSLNARGARPTLKISLPPAETLRGAQRAEACATIAKLTQFGGEYAEGRRRPAGKRSRPAWRPLLYAPEPRRNLPKRDAERYFVMMLRIAWTEAVGTPPSVAANSARPGPFARMVKRCLELVGGGHVDVAGLINDLNKRRHEMKKRLSAIKTRT
jgi:hypothetical protein